MHLINALLRRASIATPVADAADYCTRRAVDNKALGDITILPYVSVTRTHGKTNVGGVAFRTEVEARAHILRTYW